MDWSGKRWHKTFVRQKDAPVDNLYSTDYCVTADIIEQTLHSHAKVVNVVSVCCILLSYKCM